MTQPLINEVSVHCDPTTAFDLLADVRNETRWNKGVSAAQLRSEEPIGEGSKFVTVYRGTDNDVTIAEFDRPRRLVVAAGNNRIDIDTTYTFTGENGGTRVVVSTDMRPKGFVAVLAPVLRLFMRRELASKYSVFKQACDGQSDASSD